MSRRRWRRARRSAGGWLLRGLGPPALRRLASTWRTEELGGERLARLSPESGFIVALWHGRMLVGMPSYGERRWSVLVSHSDDGDLSERLLSAFGYVVIRGSSSRGGARALREMLEALSAGRKVILTPDGPRGPRHAVNGGLAWMARATRFPIVPLGMACDRAWRLSSWDRFTIPKPGARVVYAWGEPVWVAPTEGEEGLARAGRSVRESLIALERDGFARLGVEPDW